MIRVGVVGTGKMGRNHIRVYDELKPVEVVYIYDVNKKAAQTIEDEYGGIGGDVYSCDTLDGLIDTVESISVCVPTQFHASTIEHILNRDPEMPILIEKPMCSSPQEAIKLAKLVGDNKVNGVGHIERFNPIVPELKKIIKDPLYVEFKRHNPSSSRMEGTNVVEDLMIHDIDVMRELFCKVPDSIYAVGNDDVHSVTITTLNNLPIHLSASRKSSKKIRSIYVETPEFTIDADYMSQEIMIYSKPDRFNLTDGRYHQENLVEKVIVNKVEPLKEELNKFIYCVQNNTRFPVSIDDAINNMLICEEILRR